MDSEDRIKIELLGKQVEHLEARVTDRFQRVDKRLGDVERDINGIGASVGDLVKKFDRVYYTILGGVFMIAAAEFGLIKALKMLAL